ncbi:MAG: DNA translocase FtsK 4TM domain-containing protein [Anaerofustis sp.]
MVQTKKGTSNQKTRNRNKTAQKKEQRLRQEIFGFIYLFVGMFLLYAYFSTDSGAVGKTLSPVLIKLFGNTGCLLLFFAISIHGILLLANFKPFTLQRGAVFLYLLVLNGMTIAGFGYNNLDKYPLNNVSFFEMIWKEITPGGAVGELFAKIYVSLFSAVGAWLFVVLLSIISFILVFRRGIVEMMQSAKETISQDRPVTQITQKDNSLYIKQTEPKKKQNKQEKFSRSPMDDFLKSGKNNQQKESEESVQPKLSPMDAFLAAGSDHTQSDVQTLSDSALQKEDGTKAEKQQEPLFVEKKPVTEDPLIGKEEPKKKSGTYAYPSYNLLDTAKGKSTGAEKQEILSNAAHLEKTLGEFGIDAKVAEICMGPTVTRYELQLQPGIRVSKVVNLSDDIAMALAAQRVRIEAPIPGKSAIGIEVPNKEIAVVKLAQIIQSKEFKENSSPLAVALGKNLSGEMLVMDITKLPHLLIAGATGSGKSVCINAIIMSILYHSSPEKVRMILIDPKMVELNVYNEIPHLLIPVVTDPKLASGALNWAVREMTARYETFAEQKVRDIDGYNQKMKAENGEEFPHIVLIIDELSDLMMVSAQQVENAICRLAQLARAAGIHLILATQRPSVNVITGLIKANIPSRISFAVTSQVDSRTILDMGGAEKLLGRGDMLYYPSGMSKPIRAQCAYVSEKEVERVVDSIKQKQTAEYDNTVIEDIKSGKEMTPGSENASGFEDDLLPKAMEVAFEKGQISTSTIQRRLRLGYARAGRIIDEMEERGFISGPDGSRPRRVLIGKDEFAEFCKKD